MKYFRLIFFPCILVLISCASNDVMYDAIKADSAQAGSKIHRQIIRTASLIISVENIEDKVGVLSSMIESYGGYIKSNNRYTEKRVNLNVKVPLEKLDSFIDDVSSLGKITSNSTSSKDMTEQIVDIDARLKNLIALRSGYRELLGKANTVEEILSIEKELSEIQTEIDSIDGRRKLLLDQVAMASVNVTLEQKKIYGPLGYVGKWLMWAVGKLFVIK